MAIQLLNFIKKKLYLFIIFFILILSINSFTNTYIEVIFYVILHILFVLYSFYGDFKLNYFIVFIIGFSLDIFLINNFGPHLLTFMFFYLLINKVYKYFINQGQLIIVLSNLLFVLLLFIMEKALIYFVYGLNINFYNLLQCIIFSTILFYPIYLILNKIKSNL